MVGENVGEILPAGGGGVGGRDEEGGCVEEKRLGEVDYLECVLTFIGVCFGGEVLEDREV